MLKMRHIEGIVPGEIARFRFNGTILEGYEGESIAAALMRAGLIAQRLSPASGKARGYYCGMGQCWECAIRVEGLGVVRSCMQPVTRDLVAFTADKDI